MSKNGFTDFQYALVRHTKEAMKQGKTENEACKIAADKFAVETEYVRSTWNSWKKMEQVK